MAFSLEKGNDALLLVAKNCCGFKDSFFMSSL